MRNHLYPLTRRVWVGVALTACATLVGLGVVAMAGGDRDVPAAAPSLALVGETSTPTSTASPTQTGGPTQGPTPTSKPTDDPDANGPCAGGASRDWGSQTWRATVTCAGNGSSDILPGHYGSYDEAEAYGQKTASHWNSGKGGLPVMDGPGCDPPFVLC